MTVDLNLPTFGLDCREWLVATEAEGLVIEETDGAPVVAVLSTAVVVRNELMSARAVLSLALLDDDSLADSVDDSYNHSYDDSYDAGSNVASDDHPDNDRPDIFDAQDICVLDVRWSEGYARFAVPAPGGELAVVAEFSSAPDPSAELIDRFYDLVTSFRWAA